MNNSRRNNHFCDYNANDGNGAATQNLTFFTDVDIPNERDNSRIRRELAGFEDLDMMDMLFIDDAGLYDDDDGNCMSLNLVMQDGPMGVSSMLVRSGAYTQKDLNSSLNRAIYDNNNTLAKMIIKNILEYNPSTNLINFLKLAIAQHNSMVIEDIIPHCGFSKSSDLFITRDLIMSSDPQSKECVKLLLEWNFRILPNSHQDKEFVYAAVENGNLSIVVQLLEQGIDVNMVDPHTGFNLLTIACFNEHHEIVEKLLEHGADVNVKILNRRISHCHDIVRVLNALFSIDNKHINHITCLHISVCNSDPKTTKVLLKYGVEEEDDPNFLRIICMAVLVNNEETIRILLDHGINVKDIDSYEATILYQCIHSDFCKNNSSHQHLDSHLVRHDLRYKVAKLLLERGADRHLQTPRNDLVFQAVMKGHCRIVQLYLTHNADFQYVDSYGDTILHAAIKQNLNAEFIRTLLELQLPVNKKNNDWQTPLLVACIVRLYDQAEIIEELLKCNADIHSTDKSSMTPLHHASSFHDLEVVKIFLDNGADPNATNRNGRTPLHVSCQRQNDQTRRTIQLLLNHDANIEAIDENGRTPLFEACAFNNDAAIKCLLDNGANVNHTDKENLTPLLFVLHYAFHGSEVIKILLKHNANVHCLDMKGDPIIHFIVRKRDVKFMKHFVHTDVNFNSINRNGDTPLHVAVKKGLIKMAESLIKNGANVNILNKNNRTPLQEAIANTSTKNQGLPYVQQRILIALVRQVIKLKVAELKVNDENSAITYNSNNGIINDNNYSDRNDMLRDIQRLEAECEREIERMKTVRIGIDGLTFYDLLKKNIHLLGRFADDKIIHQTLEQPVFDGIFPLYINIVRSRFREARIRYKRYKLMNSANEFSRMVINQLFPDECIDMVLNYLNLEELKIFIEAMKLSQ